MWALPPVGTVSSYLLLGPCPIDRKPLGDTEQLSVCALLNLKPGLGLQGSSPFSFHTSLSPYLFQTLSLISPFTSYLPLSLLFLSLSLPSLLFFFFF